MQTNQILSASLIDLVFDGRNKDYGAYELRNHYYKRIRKALLITGIIAFLAFGGAVLASSMNKSPRHFKIQEGISISEIKNEKKPEKLPKPKTDPPKQEVKTEKLTTMKIVDKVDVTPPPTTDELKIADIGLDKKKGVDFINIVQPKPEDIDGGKKIIDVKSGSDEPFSVVEVDAKFPGDWKKFLERNLNPEVPNDNGAPTGSYSVVIRFVVDTEGNVSDIKALTAHGYGLEEEAIRVLRKASKWEPAIQNGVKVKAYRKQVIIFQVEE